MEKTNQAVVFQDVSKSFGQVNAVRELNFNIEPGQLITLLGPSGCGKTTTLRLIAGLEMVSKGKIFIGGKDVTHVSASDRDVSMVFQSYALFPHMNVFQNVSYGLTISRLPKEEVKEKAEAALGLVGLADYGKRLPSELSGGQQQRVAVARALVLEPEVLLFDEPLSNLDAKLRRRVRQEIRELQQKLELTTIYVTHDQEEALAVSDQIIVMNEAVIAQQGTPKDLYESPESLFVADFIGDATIIIGRMTEHEGDLAAIKIGELSLNLPHKGVNPGEIKLAVRPQSVNVHAEKHPGIPGKVLKSVYLGSHQEYTIETDQGEWFVLDTEMNEIHEENTEVSLDFKSRGVSIIPHS